jgi:hypothetical protein
VFSAEKTSLRFSSPFFVDCTFADAAARLPMERVRELELPLQRLVRISVRQKEEEEEEEEGGHVVPHLPRYEATHEIPQHLALHRLHKRDVVAGIFGPVYVRITDSHQHAIATVVYVAAMLDEKAKRDYVWLLLLSFFVSFLFSSFRFSSFRFISLLLVHLPPGVWCISRARLPLQSAAAARAHQRHPLRPSV